MKAMLAQCLRYENGSLAILDQSALPQAEIWLVCDSPETMVGFIRGLKIRGAPAIGVAAALALAAYAERTASLTAIREAAKMLRDARPTAVNLMHAIDRLLQQLPQGVDALVHAAEELFDEDVALSNGMAHYGVPLIEDGDGILTHCNTGALVSAGHGTALGVIRAAHEQGKRLHVYVDETRPLLQGGRLTAWELERLGIPYTLICDNMAASLMRLEKIQKVFVGADRIAANGDFANKIGTYSVAVLAHHHRIPFYPVAPRTTVDRACPDGAYIPIEERQADEVRGVIGYFGKVTWSPEQSPVYNPAFDVTPVELVTGLVLDTGYYSRQQLQEGILPTVCHQ